MTSNDSNFVTAIWIGQNRGADYIRFIWNDSFPHQPERINVDLCNVQATVDAMDRLASELRPDMSVTVRVYETPAVINIVNPDRIESRSAYYHQIWLLLRMAGCHRVKIVVAGQYVDRRVREYYNPEKLWLFLSELEQPPGWTVNLLYNCYYSDMFQAWSKLANKGYWRDICVGNPRGDTLLVGKHASDIPWTQIRLDHDSAGSSDVPMSCARLRMMADDCPAVRVVESKSFHAFERNAFDLASLPFSSSTSLRVLHATMSFRSVCAFLKENRHLHELVVECEPAESKGEDEKRRETIRGLARRHPNLWRVKVKSRATNYCAISFPEVLRKLVNEYTLSFTTAWMRANGESCFRDSGISLVGEVKKFIGFEYEGDPASDSALKWDAHMPKASDLLNTSKWMNSRVFDNLWHESDSTRKVLQPYGHKNKRQRK